MHSVLWIAPLPLILGVAWVLFAIATLWEKRDAASLIFTAGATLLAGAFGAYYYDVNIPVYGYGTMLLCGFIAASLSAHTKCAKSDISWDFTFDAALLGFFAGVFGARLLFFIEDGQAFQNLIENPLAFFAIWEGGLTYYGGAIAGALVILFFCKSKKISILRFADLLSPSLALGLAFGRLGCLLNGCCFGVHYEGFGALFFPENPIVPPGGHFPTQMISSLFAVGLFVFLNLLYTRRKFNGQILFVLAIVYSVFRFAIEFWRGDTVSVLWGLKISQVISIPVFIVCVALYWKYRKVVKEDSHGQAGL